MKDLFEYFEYRDFLKDHYDFKKLENFFYSYQYIGKKVDMDPSYIAKVLVKQRHLPLNKLSSFVDLLDLKGKRAEYFESLVYFCRAKSDKEAKLHYEKLLRLRSIQGSALRLNQYKFYSKWHFTAIRSILGLKDFTDEYAEIAQKLDPSLKEEQVKQAISFMLKSKLIEKDERGVLRPSQKHITSGEPIEPLAIRNFQREMIRIAERSLSEHPREIRNISTLTVAIKKDTLEDIQRIISDCREAIRQRVDLDKDPEEIYQLNLQFFPLTKVQ